MPHSPEVLAHLRNVMGITIVSSKTYPNGVTMHRGKYITPETPSASAPRPPEKPLTPGDDAL
jgi:hypothetical protein